jgi:hypothetical protein
MEVRHGNFGVWFDRDLPGGQVDVVVSVPATGLNRNAEFRSTDGDLRASVQEAFAEARRVVEQRTAVIVSRFEESAAYKEFVNRQALLAPAESKIAILRRQAAELEKAAMNAGSLEEMKPLTANAQALNDEAARSEAWLKNLQAALAETRKSLTQHLRLQLAVAHSQARDEALAALRAAQQEVAALILSKAPELCAVQAAFGQSRGAVEEAATIEI